MALHTPEAPLLDDPTLFIEAAGVPASVLLGPEAPDPEMSAEDRRKVNDALVTRIEGGDEDAAEELYQAILPFVIGATRQHNFDAPQLMELCHDSMAKIFLGIRSGQFRHEANVTTWASRIAHNTALDAIRTKIRIRELAVLLLDPVDLPLVRDEEFVEVPPALGILSSGVQQIMENAHISRNNWLPYVMFHVDGYKYQEIAEIMDLPLGTVKSRIHHAHKKANKFYKAHGRPELA